jgi:hypothetical protein
MERAAIALAEVRWSAPTPSTAHTRASADRATLRWRAYKLTPCHSTPSRLIDGVAPPGRHYVKHQTEPDRARGPRVNTQKMTSLGRFLYAQLRVRGPGRSTFASLASDLGSGRDNVSVRRLFFSEYMTIVFCSKEQIIEALGFQDDDEANDTFERLIAEVGLTFKSRERPSAPASVPHVDVFELAQHIAPVLSALLRTGVPEELARVEKESRWLYEKIRGYHSRALGARKTAEKQVGFWLLSLGKLYEQSREAGYSWHGDRVRRALSSIAELDQDIPNWQDHYRDYILLQARKGSLLRETYREDTSDGEKVLHGSRLCFEDGIRLLRNESHARGDLLEFVLTCQMLHGQTLLGNDAAAALEWEREITSHLRRLDSRRNSLYPSRWLTQAEQDMRVTITHYFLSMGYKRIVWALRFAKSRADLLLRDAYLQKALDNFRAFNDSPYRLSAWYAADFHDPLPGCDDAFASAVKLLSPQQVNALLLVNERETIVWQRPESTRDGADALAAAVGRQYPSAVVKVLNTQRFAETLVARGG